MEPRDRSRLLVLDRSRTGEHERAFHELPGELQEGDLLVVNETRVLPARLLTRLERTGRSVEVLFSHPEPRRHEAGERWIALLGPSRRLRPGDRLVVGDDAVSLVEAKGGGQWVVRPEGRSAESMMSLHGHLPIPPYLGREDVPEDREWYQTVFAREAGAIAAPTAGLHFTSELMRALEERGIGLARVVLHVGPGTFLPVRAASLEEHDVLPERFAVPKETADAIATTRARGRRVVAVGTTVVRALESSSSNGWTALTIRPGHAFRVVDAMVTNFHLPRSSLLLLVSAFAGRERVLSAYQNAIGRGFRFYSYGDAMLIL